MNPRSTEAYNSLSDGNTSNNELVIEKMKSLFMRCGDILQCSKSKDRRKNTKQEQSKYGPLRGTGVIKDEHPLLVVHTRRVLFVA